MKRQTIPKTFVASKFQPLAQLFWPHITRMWYFVDRETKEEYVNVEYEEKQDDGRKTIAYFQICVSADSAEAMVSDIWRGLNRRLG